MRRLGVALLALALLAGAGFVGWRIWRGPDPAEILAGLEVPPSPPLSAEDERSTFRLAPGFRIELVAAEPLVVDPVAIDWDDEGRLYVVEMRGFMPDVDGTGEGAPLGRVVVLEDMDGDGTMDRSDVFADGLALPRAIAVLPDGVLIGVEPDLWLCRDTDGDRSCDERTRLGEYAVEGPNPEHKENGLLPGLDGWIYNAKSNRRLRLEGDALEVGKTLLRGQWGIAQDDAGRLYYNHNSGFLYGDSFPAEYAMRQPAVAAQPEKPGLSVDLARGAEVFGVRVAPGLNRAYLAGSLRPDGRQLAPTAVSGLAIQRGDQFGAEFVGDAFIPESAGAAVAHFAIDRRGLTLEAEHRLHADPDWGQREFLASTDERFRPVDAEFGPDGAIWVVDMYRGVIQHAYYVSDYLRAYVEKHGLGAPGETGRIWRIVRDDRPIAYRPPALATLTDQLEALDHPNGWVRDRAQRRIAFERSPDAVPALRRLEDFGALGRRHALWALDRMSALDETTWRRAVHDADPQLRVVALRVGERLAADPRFDARAELDPLLADPDPAVRLQAWLSLGTLPPASRPLGKLLELGRTGDPIERLAAASGLAGLERRALQGELALLARSGAALDDATREWLEQIAAAALLAEPDADDAAASPKALLDIASSIEDDAAMTAVLAGIAKARRLPGSRRVELAEAHPLFDEDRAANDSVRNAIASIRSHFTWPGDPRPGGARPLTPAESALRERGRALFDGTCVSCHGADGRGQAGLAPSLVGSPWVRDADEWLVRIVLAGLTGPIRVDGEDWDGNMPAHGRDPRFDDAGLAGLATHLRRSWGHAENPLTPERVGAIRREIGDRKRPFTAEELLALPVVHRLDRYVGVYAVPIVGIELIVGRRGPQLTIARDADGPAGELTEIGSHGFIAQGLTIYFEVDESDGVGGASVSYGGTTFPVARQEQ